MSKPSQEAVVRAESVSKAFEEAGQPHPVLESVDLEVRAGETVALLGRSGSGKSTLLNLIAGIDAPDAGRIWVADQDLAAMDDGQRSRFRRHHIGFVYQFFNLLPTLSALENVRLPLELQGRADADDRARHWLAEVGLADRAQTFPDRLSGGEQQRIAVARALAGEPQLILADEPTGNLDAEVGERVLALLLEMGRGPGRALIVVTHSRSVAARADRVLRVVDHQVVELDPLLAELDAPA